MFVGEAPGADEDAQGVPFVGAAGKLLNKMLTNLGLRREEVYIANIVKSRPRETGTPRPMRLPPACPSWKSRSRPSARVIVTLGRIATHALLGTKEPLTRLRGHWQRYNDIRVMPTFHPLTSCDRPRSGARPGTTCNRLWSIWLTMKKLKYLIPLLALLLLAGLATGAAAARAVYVLQAVGSINPGLAEFMAEGIRRAERENAEALVIELDTPGGLETSMRQIVQSISNAKVPVVVYVYPRGPGPPQPGLRHDGGERGRHGARDQHRCGPPGLHRHGQDR